MHTFDEALEQLYLERKISKEEALAGARDPSRIERLRRGTVEPVASQAS
jgi:Tfp pilus assembly ATPase PilU